MPKKEHPKVRREKAAQLLEDAKQEQAKRHTEIGRLFSETYLGEKPKNNGTFEQFKEKASEILNRSTKKVPSPKDLEVMASELVKEAEQEEADRKQQIGENLLKLLKDLPPDQQDPQIKAMVREIWGDSEHGLRPTPIKPTIVDNNDRRSASTKMTASAGEASNG